MYLHFNKSVLEQSWKKAYPTAEKPEYQTAVEKWDLYKAVSTSKESVMFFRRVCPYRKCLGHILSVGQMFW